MILCAI